jgi:hypothetical protein
MSNNGVNIVWTTNQKAVAWVEIVPNYSANFYSYERPHYYDTKFGRIQVTTTLHKVRIENLQPGTSYRYAIFQRNFKIGK